MSVVVPCYRCPDTLQRALASVRAQSRRPREVVLVEDASDDGGATRASIERQVCDWPGDAALVLVFLEQNGGVAAARNAGWSMATQPYVAFLDADDAWHPCKLEIQIGWMEMHPEAAMTATLRPHVDRLSDLPEPADPIGVRELSFRATLMRNRIPTASVVVRGDLPNRFATTKRYSEDYLLWLDILASGRRVFLFEAALTCAFKRSFGAAGLSAQLWRMQRGELDCYRRLAAAGAITTGTRLGLQLLSWGKFGRRLLVTLPLKLRRHGVAVCGLRADAAKSERSEPAGDVPAA